MPERTLVPRTGPQFQVLPKIDRRCPSCRLGRAASPHLKCPRRQVPCTTLHRWQRGSSTVPKSNMWFWQGAALVTVASKHTRCLGPQPCKGG